MANRIFPPYMVASQLKILIPVGTEISMVEAAKKVFETEVMPIVNMWWAHTDIPRKPIAIVAPTMADLPKMGLREKIGITSEMVAKPGKIRIYTSGCPKIQKKCCQSTAEPPA